MGSNYSKSTSPTPAIGSISEKQMIVERHDSHDKSSVDVNEALTSDNITKWTKALDEVSFTDPAQVSC